MPWTTPTLRQVREIVRGEITAKLAGASFVGNSVLRVVADANAALAHLVLRFIEWLAKQLMPDLAETEWLDRHGDIWLTNSDHTTGRKEATYSAGSVTITGTVGSLVPSGTAMIGALGTNFETLEQVAIGNGPTKIAVRAIDPGTVGNLDAGDIISFVTPVAGVDGSATVVELYGGTDQETDEELRARVLLRIREPPMGGDAADYVEWALAVPGVTRAWCSPNEMGIGTVTVRFMMDDLRKSDDPETNGFPNDTDVETVRAYLNQTRPVAVKDFFCEAPIPEPINFTLSNMSEYDASVMEEIAQAVDAMLRERAAPASAKNGIPVVPQVIYEAWVSEAVKSAMGELDYFDLHFVDHEMPSKGHLAVLGTITYG